MTLLTQAISFASQAHEGMLRKGTNTPYIVHPMETAAIAASLTDDEELIAAAMLHDVIEDCSVSADELRTAFSPRVAELVLSESTEKFGDPCETWEIRKRMTIERLSTASRDVKIIALSDKLSNMRAIARDYLRLGDGLFARFHQHDRHRYGWYYASCAQVLYDELGDTLPWMELNHLIFRVFGESCPQSKTITPFT